MTAHDVAREIMLHLHDDKWQQMEARIEKAIEEAEASGYARGLAADEYAPTGTMRVSVMSAIVATAPVQQRDFCCGQAYEEG